MFFCALCSNLENDVKSSGMMFRYCTVSLRLAVLLLVVSLTRWSVGNLWPGGEAARRSDRKSFGDLPSRARTRYMSRSFVPMVERYGGRSAKLWRSLSRR